VKEGDHEGHEGGMGRRMGSFEVEKHLDGLGGGGGHNPSQNKDRLKGGASKNAGKGESKKKGPSPERDPRPRKGGGTREKIPLRCGMQSNAKAGTRSEKFTKPVYNASGTAVGEHQEKRRASGRVPVAKGYHSDTEEIISAAEGTNTLLKSINTVIQVLFTRDTGIFSRNTGRPFAGRARGKNDGVQMGKKKKIKKNRSRPLATKCCRGGAKRAR